MHKTVVLNTYWCVCAGKMNQSDQKDTIINESNDEFSQVKLLRLLNVRIQVI